MNLPNPEAVFQDDRYTVLPVQRAWKPLFPEINRYSCDVPPRLKDAFRECRKGLAPWPLLILGDVGVGKTRFCLCIYDWYGGRYTELSTLADEFAMVRRGEFRDLRWTTEPKVYERDWIKMLEDERILIVDDIGRRSNESEHVRDTLIRVLNAREGGRPLVVVSNLTLDQLSESYDDRIASRLSAGTVINAEGDDRRVEGTVVR